MNALKSVARTQRVKYHWFEAIPVQFEPQLLSGKTVKE